jgi:hypothetical protein
MAALRRTLRLGGVRLPPVGAQRIAAFHVTASPHTMGLRLGDLRPRGLRLGGLSLVGAQRIAAFHVSQPRRDTWLPWNPNPNPKSKSHPELHEVIEKWGPRPFYSTGVGLTAGLGIIAFLYGPISLPTLATAVPVGLWWYIGLNDMWQTQHTIRRNFPVLGNLRYLLESIRPEIRQYFIETEVRGQPAPRSTCAPPHARPRARPEPQRPQLLTLHSASLSCRPPSLPTNSRAPPSLAPQYEANPISRARRTLVYQRAKGARDTIPFGTRDDVYAVGHEWANHSMFPKVAPLAKSRVTFGGPDCKQPYSGSILNISGMSYGALSDNAILALNKAAKMGGFYHNTGEGGVSAFHRQHGGDLVWNIGTGYFGCRRRDGGFDAARFKETAANECVKMIELKLSQGAKPAHGGMLPKSKITPAIAEARGIGMDQDCNSPPAHTAFSGAHSMMEFLAKVRPSPGARGGLAVRGAWGARGSPVVVRARAVG